jgi:hypothetical protein
MHYAFSISRRDSTRSINVRINEQIEDILPLDDMATSYG